MKKYMADGKPFYSFEYFPPKVGWTRHGGRLAASGVSAVCSDVDVAWRSPLSLLSVCALLPL